MRGCQESSFERPQDQKKSSLTGRFRLQEGFQGAPIQPTHLVLQGGRGARVAVLDDVYRIRLLGRQWIHRVVLPTARGKPGIQGSRRGACTRIDSSNRYDCAQGNHERGKLEPRVTTQHVLERVCLGAHHQQRGPFLRGVEIRHLSRPLSVPHSDVRTTRWHVTRRR